MSTILIDRPRQYGKEKLSRGIEAILRAREDALEGRLTCPCEECELRQLTEEVDR